MSVLLPLVTDRHAHHACAIRWMDGVSVGEAIVCRMAQTGLLRLLNNPAVMQEDVLETDACWGLWHRLLEDDRIRFSPTEPPGLDEAFRRFTAGRAFAPRLWTDAYLAAYAHAGRLTVVSFDKGFHSFPGLACEVLGTSPPPG
ncbi:MAG: PIN domain-containing protein [Planctomycetes bacterium]|nr:PIN domain-containing protein [Planctomycetota bacterium]